VFKTKLKTEALEELRQKIAEECFTFILSDKNGIVFAECNKLDDKFKDPATGKAYKLRSFLGDYFKQFCPDGVDPNKDLGEFLKALYDAFAYKTYSRLHGHRFTIQRSTLRERLRKLGVYVYRAELTENEPENEFVFDVGFVWDWNAFITPRLRKLVEDFKRKYGSE